MVNSQFRARKGILLCHSAEWPSVFTQSGLSFVAFVARLHWLYPVYTNTHTLLSHTNKHTLLWVLIHLLAVCPGNLPRGCWAVTLTLFLFPFLCCVLFVPLLMEITQEDVGFLCYNNLFRRVFTCWEVHRGPPIRCFTNRVCMKPAEVALIVDRKSFQEISLLHDNARNFQRSHADLWTELAVCCAASDGRQCEYVASSRASLVATYPRQRFFRVFLARKTATFTHKSLFSS